MASPPPELPRDPETLQAMLIAREAEIERLRQIIKELQRHRFGRRAETLPEDQLLLGLEEAEQVEAAEFAASEETAPAEKAPRARQRGANRGALPRIEMIVDIESDLSLLFRQAPSHRRGCGRAPCRISEPHRSERSSAGKRS